MHRSYTASNIEEANKAPSYYQRRRLREYLSVPGCAKASIVLRGKRGRVIAEDDEIVHVMADVRPGGWTDNCEVRVGASILPDSSVLGYIKDHAAEIARLPKGAKIESTW